jgi:hypothetical protein
MSIVLKFFDNQNEVSISDWLNTFGLPISIFLIWLLFIVPFQLIFIYHIGKFIYSYKYIIRKLDETGVIDLKYLKIKEKIGGGSFGEVFKGDFTFIPIAIKKIPIKTDIDNINLINSELEITKSCHHENIVDLIGYCNDGSNFYLGI